MSRSRSPRARKTDASSPKRKRPRSPKIVVRELERLRVETSDLFAGLTGYLLEMEGGIKLAAHQNDEAYSAIVSEYEAWFLDDEWWGDRDPDRSHQEQHRKTYEVLLPGLLRYSVIVLTATVAERQIRLMGQILGGSIADEMKSIASARGALRSSPNFDELARADSEDWLLLTRLSEVRNCIVHAHGYVAEMNAKHQASLRTFITEKKHWHGMQIGEQGELVPGDFVFGRHRINFSMWVHQETKSAVLKLIRAVSEVCRNNVSSAWRGKS